jgi:transposase-like protein
MFPFSVRTKRDHFGMDRDSLKLLLGMGLSLAQIGRRFDKDPSTVGYRVRKHGLEAAHRERHSSKGAPSRRELETLVSEGRSIAAIARELGRSETSVKYWLKKWHLQTAAGLRRQKAERAKREGRATVQLVCRHHGLSTFWIEGRGSYRCTKCRGEWVSRRRRRVKDTLVAEAGGACAVCGYSRCVGALQFHHVDPTTKSFSLAQQGNTRGIDQMREEAHKCVLLCANCHAEVEAGIVELGKPRSVVRLPQTGSPG